MSFVITCGFFGIFACFCAVWMKETFGKPLRDEIYELTKTGQVEIERKKSMASMAAMDRKRFASYSTYSKEYDGKGKSLLSDT